MSDSIQAAAELPDALFRLYDDPETAATSLRKLADETVNAERAAGVFAALSNPQRLRLLVTLQAGEHCVCELQTALDAPQSTVATHLRCLADVGLISARKEGRWSYYRLADTAVFELIEQAATLSERSPKQPTDDPTERHE